jgi:hypothetical protein
MFEVRRTSKYIVLQQLAAELTVETEWQKADLAV